MCVSFLQVKRKAVKKQRQRLREGLLLVIHSVAPIAVTAIFYALEVNTTRKLKKYKPTRFMEKTSRYDTAVWTYPPLRILRHSFWCFLRWMKMTNTSFCRTFGYRRIISTFESGVTMCHTMCGNDRVFFKPRKVMLFTTATSKSSSKTWANALISVKLPSTAGVLYRWYRISKGWASRSFLSGKALKICRRRFQRIEITRRPAIS